MTARWWLSGPKELDNLLDAPRGPHYYEVVARSHHHLRSGRRDGLITSQDSHDRHTGATPYPGLTNRAVRKWGVLSHRKPVDGQPLDLLVELGQLLGHARRPEHLRKRASILLAQSEHPLEAVGIVAVGEVDLSAAGTMRD